MSSLAISPTNYWNSTGDTLSFLLGGLWEEESPKILVGGLLPKARNTKD